MTQTVTRPAVRNGILAALLTMVDTTDELPIDGAALKT